MEKIQVIAANTVARVIGGKNLNQELKEVFRRHFNLQQSEKSQLQDLCYGTVRHFGKLEAILKELLNKPLSNQELRYLLLVSIYQLLFTRAAEHAVVNHAVAGARKINQAVSGLTNAVLRNFIRKKQELLQKVENTLEGKYSYPSWWIQKLAEQYENTEALLATGNQHPPLTLRINRNRTSVESYLELLKQNEISARITEPEAVILDKPMNVENIPGFREGMVSVQDAGAQYAALLLDIQQGMRVLDACAAPGGKTAHMLEMQQIEMTALDHNAERLQRIQENLDRLKLKATLICGDASTPQNWWNGVKYQRILADVPCSAAGVIRRHPDIKWIRKEKDITQFASQQLAILEALWPLLETNGKLLYATCSIFKQENQDVIQKFMNIHSEAAMLPLNIPDAMQGQLIPDDNHDGFYYALLFKQS